MKRQASYGRQNWDSQLKIRTKTFWVCTITSGKVCSLCGSVQFHTASYFAKQNRLEGKWEMGPFWPFWSELLWEIPTKTTRGVQAKCNQNSARRVTYIDYGDSSNVSFNKGTGNIVLTNGGCGEAPL